MNDFKTVVGQDGILRPIGNRPSTRLDETSRRPIANRPQVINLPHKGVWVLFGVWITITGCSSKPKEAETEAVVPVQVAEVKRDSIRRIVSAQAILFPVDQANVMPKISAPVKTFHVKRGDHVPKGQLLPVLGNRALAAAVGDNKGAYQQAKSALRTTSAATVPEESNKAQQDVQAAKQAMDAAQKVYESRKQLFDQGALARRLVEEASITYVTARGTY